MFTEVHIHCPGTPGHGSLLLPETAGEKVRYVIDAFMDYRAKEKAKLEANTHLSIGDVTTINLTRVKVKRKLEVIMRGNQDQIQ